MKVGKDRVREKVGGDFDKWGMGKGSAEIVVGQVNGPEKSWQDTTELRRRLTQGREAT